MNVNEEYNKESKKAFIENSIKGFAYELYLLNKHQHKQDVDILFQLHEFLDCPLSLTEREEKTIIRKAIKTANDKYNSKL